MNWHRQVGPLGSPDSPRYVASGIGGWERIISYRDLVAPLGTSEVTGHLGQSHFLLFLEI